MTLKCLAKAHGRGRRWRAVILETPGGKYIVATYRHGTLRYGYRDIAYLADAAILLREISHHLSMKVALRSPDGWIRLGAVESIPEWVESIGVSHG